MSIRKTRKIRKIRKTRKSKKFEKEDGKVILDNTKIVKLPSIKSLETIYKRKITKQKGGNPLELSVRNFPISGDIIENFKKIKPGQHDCVISVLELINVLDEFSSKFMRACVGKKGVSLEEIEKIFTLKFSNKFEFLSSTNIDEWANLILDNTLSQHVVFCGVEYDNGQLHVFLIGKDIDGSGSFIKLDAQQKYALCVLKSGDLMSDNSPLRIPSCRTDSYRGKKYFLLGYNSKTLTGKEVNDILIA